jgi:peroxiredoxin
MTLAVGLTAPEFALPVKPREAPIRLSDSHGEKPVVLLFFPLAFSSVCTAEMCYVAENYAAWEALNAQVIGISVDSPYVNVKFAEECKAPFPIASDFNKDVSAAYEALAADMGGLKGVTKRVAYVIDRSGTIVYAWEGENPGVMPDFGAIMEAVEQAD